MDTLYIVMPAYNEEKNIESVVRSWYPVLKGKSESSRLVIADSGSRDRTHEILEQLRSGEFSQLEILHTDNQYHGPINMRSPTERITFFRPIRTDRRTPKSSARSGRPGESTPEYSGTGK